MNNNTRRILIELADILEQLWLDFDTLSPEVQQENIDALRELTKLKHERLPVLIAEFIEQLEQRREVSK